MLCHRFLEGIRLAKPTREDINLGIGQRIAVASSQELRIDGEPFHGLSPAMPGFFEITDAENTTLVRGACHFDDPLEADLRAAAPEDAISLVRSTVLDDARRHSPWWRPLLLVAVALVVASWAWLGRPVGSTT